MLTISKLSFTYSLSKEAVLSGFDLSISSPSTNLIIGSNASGKSTLLDIISGFKQPSAGKVYINRADLYLNPKLTNTLRSIISYMPSDLNLPAKLSVGYLLKLWKGPYFINELIDELKLMQFLDFDYGELSDGYKARLHMAIALSRGSFIFLDEPLKSQDEDLISVFPKLLDRYTKGRTILVASPHYLNFKLWDGVFRIKGGAISEYDKRA